VVGVDVDLLPGATKQVSFHFSFPGIRGMLTLVPSARIPPETWNVDGKTFTDQTSRVITW
jgi:hypothetical protein